MSRIDRITRSVSVPLAILSVMARPPFAEAQIAIDKTGAVREIPPVITIIGPPPPLTSAQPPRPDGRVSDWFNDNDYPTRSLQLGVHGVVRFRLTVARDGTSSACVIRKSISVELDEATCALAMKRAHFIPAMDAAGKPTTGYFFGARQWGSGDANPIPTTKIWQLAYDVKADGRIANCVLKMTGFTPGEMVGQNEANACSGLNNFAPSVDQSGKRSQKHVVVVSSVVVTDGP